MRQWGSCAPILLIGISIISMAGCQTTPRQLPPIKPQLSVSASSDGGICMDRESAIRLGEYILSLEQGYE